MKNNVPSSTKLQKGWNVRNCNRKYLNIMKVGHGWKSPHWQQAAGYECDKTKKGKEEIGEEVEVEDGEGCKVNIAPFDGWGRKGSTWVIDVGILRDFA